jgi:hypothetical protein
VPIPYDPSRAALYRPERRETLFAPGATYTPLQLAIEGARLAYYRIESSKTELERLTAALACAGFGAPTPFLHAATGSESFAAIRHADGTALVAFRGTRPDALRDLLTDARANLVAWPEAGGRVHAGFATAARALLPGIRDWLAAAEHDPGRMILAGHSLGAALATLAASVIPGNLVTLGSPRVGDRQFAATVTARGTHLVGCCDGVTDLPPPFGGYTHPAPRIYLTRNAERITDPPADLVRADRREARWEYAVRYAWRRSTVWLRSFADHAPINYARAFWP